MTLELMLDVFNVFNRPNVDEVGSVYGSPIFCGAIPRHYKDAASLAIGSGGAAAPVCPQGDFPLGPSGLAPSFASTPLTPPATLCVPTGATCLFIPVSPNTTFGKPRTMFNPRQLQFGAKFSF